MAWHLKDRELESKLIAIDPNFVKTLTDTVEEKLANNVVNDDSVAVVELTYNGVYLGMVSVFTNRLEEVPEYNPKAWNNYPEVMPPYSAVYQLKVCVKEGCPINYYAAFYDFEDKTWRVHDSGRQIDTKVSEDGFVVFRPWKD